MATILCIDNDPLTPQVVRAQLAEEALDCPLALATTTAAAIAHINAIASTPSPPLVIVSQALIDPAWLKALYDRFPQALLVVLAAEQGAAHETLGALVPPGQLYRWLPQPWQPADLRLTIAEALRRGRYEQQLAQMQAALGSANQPTAPLPPPSQRLAPSPATVSQSASGYLGLEPKLQAAQMRLSQLRQRVMADPAGDRPLLEMSIVEVANALEELQAATEELQRQNLELLAAQHTLATQHQRYQNLFDFAPDAYLVTDGAGILQAINGAAEQLLNLRRDRAVGKPLAVFVAETDHGLLYQLLNRSLPSVSCPQTPTLGAPTVSTATLLVCDHDLSIRPREQEAFTVSLSLSRECDRQGNTLFYWLLHDGRARQQVEQELRRNRELREAIFNESTDALFLVDVTTDLIFDCNDRSVTLFEAEAKIDLIGLQGNTLQCQPFTPAELTVARQTMAQHGVWSAEVEYLSLRGRRFWGNLAAKPIAVAGNAMMLVRLTDITERRQIEAQIRYSEQQLQLTLAFTGVGAWRWYPATGAYEWNGPLEKLLEIPPGQDNMLQLWRDRIHPDDVDRVDAAIETSLATGLPFTEQYRYYLLNGQLCWRWLKGQGLYTAAGDLEHVLGIVQDVTEQRQTEAALKVSEEHRQLALELTNTGSWELDVATGKVRWSESHYRLMGLPPDQPITYATWRDAVHPEDRDWAEGAFAQAMATGTLLDMEYRLVLPDGTLRWVLTRGHGLYDSQGQPLKMLGVMVDISDRKGIEDSLKQSQEQLQMALEFGRMAIWTWDAVTDQLRWNDIAYQLLGIEPGPDPLTYDHWLQAVHPQDRAPVQLEIDRAVAERRPFALEYRVLWPDGTQRWIADRGQSIYAPDGQELRSAGIMYDITERKTAQLALQDSETRFRQLAETVREGFFVFDVAQGCYEYVNPAFEGLADTAALTHRGMAYWLDNVHPDDRDRVAVAAQMQLRGVPLDQEYRFYGPDGELRWLRSQGYPVRGEDGTVVRVVGTVEDIGERKRGEAERKRAELALHQLNSELEQRVQQRTQELQKLAAIVENSTDFIGTASLSGTALYINRSGRQLIGLPAEEAITGAITDFHRADTVERLVQEVLPIAIQQGYWRGESTLRHRQTGEDIVVEQVIFLIRDAQTQEPLCMGTTCRDIRDRKQAEINLQESEARFRQITETIQEVFWMTTADSSQTLYVSPAFERVWGISCDTLYQSIEVLAEAIHPDDLADVEAALHPDRIHNYDQVYRIRRTDGEIRWIHDRAFPVLNDRGEVYRIVGVANDITDRKQAEQAEQDSRTMLQLVLDTIPQRVFWKDRDSRYLGCNPAFAQDLQLIPDQVVGKVDSDLPFVVNACRYRAEDAQIISSQTSRLGYEELLPSPDPDIERWARTSKVPLTDNNGEVIGVLGCYEDITDYKQAEMQLREQEQFLRSIYEGVNQPVCVSEVAADGTVRVLGLNPAAARLFGTTSAAVAGKALDDAFGAKEAAEILQRYRHCIATNRPLTFERSLTVAGKTHWLLGTYNPIANAEGRVYRIVGSMYNISDRKRAEAALQQLNTELEQRVQERTQALQQAMETAQSASRAKSTFLANMSHELRTPLNAILGFAQLMARDFALGSGNRQSLEIINRSGEHLLELINDILEMAKIEAGQVSLNPLCFDLDTLLGTLGDMFGVRARGKGLTLTIDRHPALPRYLRGDEPKLRQVLINLLGNAIKFTARGQVCLRLAPAHPIPPSLRPGMGLSIAFTVSDTGIGIAAEHLDRLFAPFVQVNQGAGVFEGTGLGLSISHQFVQLLGGTLTVESQLGTGSTFAFALPMQVVAGLEASAPALPAAQIAELAPGQPSYRILVVDDDDTHRQLLTQLLTAVGFGVCEARDGQEAIALWERWQPQLIWLDMRMPTLSGSELAQHIRAQEQANGLTPTKLIALTANAFEEDRTQALAMGCDDFVRKPFQLSQVLTKLAEHLGVQYTYGPEPPAAAAAPLAEADAIAALGTLPPPLLRQLYHATLQLDSELITQLVDQLSADHRPLADLLYQHLDNFAFDTIHDLLEQILNR